ncbi:MAG: aromatic-ring-hydroxylating dioxygenase subunit beta [Myxococcota bacterium]
MSEQDDRVARLLLQHEVEAWYAQEARWLDGREFQKWLGLCAPEIRYVVPGRGNPLVDNRLRGQEEMISVERELEGHSSDGLPIRDETFAYLAVRVERAYKPNSWAENPPARTRRIVGNIEIMESSATQVSVVSAFHLHWSRPGNPNYLYAGQRRDQLTRVEDAPAGEWRLLSREVVLDMAEIEYPTLGLFF